jgi:hypothetical protein
MFRPHIDHLQATIFFCYWEDLLDSMTQYEVKYDHFCANILKIKPFIAKYLIYFGKLRIFYGIVNSLMADWRRIIPVGIETAPVVIMTMQR